MDASHLRWFRTVVLVGAAYLLVGLISAPLAGSSTSHQAQFAWRLAAWAASALVFMAHFGYEQSQPRNSALTTAYHVSAGVALGAFFLAGAANVHALWATTGNQRLLAFALVLWPVVCGLPAFLVSLAAAAVLSLARRSGKHGTGAQ